jgi:hypothetical protein
MPGCICTGLLVFGGRHLPASVHYTLWMVDMNQASELPRLALQAPYPPAPQPHERSRDDSTAPARFWQDQDKPALRIA